MYSQYKRTYHGAEVDSSKAVVDQIREALSIWKEAETKRQPSVPSVGWGYEVQPYGDNGYVCAIVPPLCARVIERVPQASEMWFMDATHSLDTYGSAITPIWCATAVKSLPLCFLVHSSCEANAIRDALGLFLQVIGRRLVPQVVMTDKDDAEIGK